MTLNNFVKTRIADSIENEINGTLNTSIITLSSGKGGTGKSTTATILATGLIHEGRQDKSNVKVLVLDLDTQETATRFGKRRKRTINKRKENTHPSAKAKTKRMECIEFITYNPLDPKGDGWAGFKKKINESVGKYDYIIIDTPGHLDNIVIQGVAFECSDLVLITTRTTIEDMEQIQNMNSYVKLLKTNPKIIFDPYIVVWTLDCSDRLYNDYEDLKVFDSTLPILKYDNKDCVLPLRKSVVSASADGLTPIEANNDELAKNSYLKFTKAVMNALNK